MINRNMRFFESEVTIPDFLDAWKSEEMDVDEKALLLLTFVGEEVIAFLRSYTGNKIAEHKSLVPRHPDQQEGFARPEPYLGTRLTHPGGWADVSGDLMRKYKFRVDNDGNGWRLAIINNSEHAVFVEAMAGLFVVHGVLDPSGPVERALKKAMKQLTPGWQLRTFNGKQPIGSEFPDALSSTVELNPE